MRVGRLACIRTSLARHGALFVRRMRSSIVLGCLACLALLPACRHAPDRYAQNPVFGTCINGLGMIDGAKQEWALKGNRSTNAAPTLDDLRPYLRHIDEKDLDWLRCPSGGTYMIGQVGEPPTCSFGGPGHTLQ